MSRRRIGFLGPTISHPISQLVWQGARAAAVEAGHEFLLFSGGFIKDFSIRADQGAASFSFARAPLIDGLVVYGAALGQFTSDAVVKEILAGFSVPVVNIGLEMEGLPWVVIDNRGGLAKLVAHCTDVHGYRDFAIVTGPPDHQEAKLRLETTLEVLGDRGIRVEPERILTGDFSIDSGIRAVRTLRSGGRLPRAIVAADDDTAQGVVQELLEGGTRVPDEVAVIGFDDTDLARLGVPGISTVHQDLSLQGREAVRSLCLILDGKPADNLKLATVPVYRESCGCQANRVVDDTGTEAWMGDLLQAIRGELLAGPPSGQPGLEALVGRVRRLIQGHPLPDFDLIQRGLDRMRQEFLDPQRVWAPQVDRKADGNLLSMEEVFHELQTLCIRSAIHTELGQRIENTQNFAELAVVNQDLNGVLDWDSMAGVILDALPTLGIASAFIVGGREGSQRLILGGPPEGEGTGPLEDRVIEYWTRDLSLGRSERVMVVEPLTFAGLSLGWAFFHVRADHAALADLFANDLGNLVHRISLIEEMKATENRLRHSLMELNRTQRRLVESQRLAALGRLVAGVAHELNTPLGVAVTAFSFLKDTLRKGSAEGSEAAIGEALDLVERGIFRAVDIVDRFRAVSVDPQEAEVPQIDTGRVLDRLLSAQLPLLSARGIALEQDLESGLQTKLGVANLQRIVSELVANTLAHAFGPGVPTQARPTLRVTLVRKGDTAVLEFLDNGRGIPSERLRDIFVPFAGTMKADGHIGLGLHMVYNLVNGALDGEVTCRSDPGLGTCVSMALPLDAGRIGQA